MNLLQISLVLGAVMAVRSDDPSTICFPPVFQAAYLNLIREDKGNIYVDFSKELWVEESSVTGVRTVSDFMNLRTHLITGQGNDTACQSFKLRPNQIMHSCLPRYHGTTDMYVYLDINRTISNPAVFILPPECVTQDLNLATIVG